ncbi:hypothetical protein DPMN_047391 [Dreissena polymorpha]|uniref:Uncharacterized protein n=1 Tax=Dreissena polymorpha TaxID=45954 RepID=A0A9D4I327_DREPO|nr:hypothetical protein DPMN_047391 [Dreissena polymorpha]
MLDIVYDRKGWLGRPSGSERTVDDSDDSPWQQEREEEESVLQLEVCEDPCNTPVQLGKLIAE